MRRRPTPKSLELLRMTLQKLEQTSPASGEASIADLKRVLAIASPTSNWPRPWSRQTPNSTKLTSPPTWSHPNRKPKNALMKWLAIHCSSRSSTRAVSQYTCPLLHLKRLPSIDE